MKKLFFFFVAVTCLHVASAQMDLPPSGGNARAKITEEVGITDITISYSRPDVKDRDGKIWGGLVTYGFSTQNFITNKNTSPWRAGANENTTITFEHDVKVEGKDLKAGTYGLFMAVWPEKVTIIFSNQYNAWGSFYYEEKNDALRVDVKPMTLDKDVEYLKYEFTEHKEKSCIVALMWEKLMIPFRIDVDVDNIVLNRLREQVTSQKGFNQVNLAGAVNYCLSKKINLDEALGWAQRAAALKSYNTLRVLAATYDSLNRIREGDSVMTEALAMANLAQYTGYARALIAAKRPDKAVEVLLAAKPKFGDIAAVNSGLMFSYSAKADYKNALVYANKTMAQIPKDNDAAKKTLEGQIAKLKDGKDIN